MLKMHKTQKTSAQPLLEVGDEVRDLDEPRERIGDGEGVVPLRTMLRGGPPGTGFGTSRPGTGRGGLAEMALEAETTTAASGKWVFILPQHLGDGEAGVVGGATGTDTEQPRNDDGSLESSSEEQPAALLDVSPTSSIDVLSTLPSTPCTSPKSDSSSR